MWLDDDFRAGHALTAADLNLILAELRRLGKVSAAPPLHVSDGPDGLRFDLDDRPTFPIKVLSGGSGGKYPWTGQVPVAGGGWADDPNTAVAGTLASDPAYEANANASVPANTIILRAWRDPQTDRVNFERGSC